MRTSNSNEKGKESKKNKNNQKNKKWIQGMCILMLGFVSTSSYATVAQERMYLTQVLNELSAVQPLILAAQAAQPKNRRVQFHYTRFQDNHGHWHNGLLEDIQSIRSGIQQQLNGMPVEPRAFAPIKGDYIDPNNNNGN